MGETIDECEQLEKKSLVMSFRGVFYATRNPLNLIDTMPALQGFLTLRVRNDSSLLMEVLGNWVKQLMSVSN